MPDREKVINHFEDALSKIKPVDWWVSVRKDFLSDALALLKDKKAVKPLAIKQEMFDEYYGAVACCPKCDCMWIMYIDNDMHYCPECGQAVKWE